MGHSPSQFNNTLQHSKSLTLRYDCIGDSCIEEENHSMVPKASGIMNKPESTKNN